MRVALQVKRAPEAVRVALRWRAARGLGLRRNTGAVITTPVPAVRRAGHAGRRAGRVRLATMRQAARLLAEEEETVATVAAGRGGSRGGRSSGSRGLRWRGRRSRLGRRRGRAVRVAFQVERAPEAVGVALRLRAVGGLRLRGNARAVVATPVPAVGRASDAGRRARRVRLAAVRETARLRREEEVVVVTVVAAAGRGRRRGLRRRGRSGWLRRCRRRRGTVRVTLQVEVVPEAVVVTLRWRRVARLRLVRHTALVPIVPRPTVSRARNARRRRRRVRLATLLKTARLLLEEEFARPAVLSGEDVWKGSRCEEQHARETSHY